MSIEQLQGFLLAFENLNHGVNHGCTYAIYSMSGAESLQKVIEKYYSLLNTSNAPVESAAAWNIRMNNLGSEWQLMLRKVIIHWFFEQEFSPRVDIWMMNACADQVINYLVSDLGDFEVFEVFTDPPMWYECSWQDFAIATEGAKWLLHFGFSD